MNCPLCIDQTLEPRRKAGIEIDVCPHCRGIWLDRGELERLAAEPDIDATPEPPDRYVVQPARPQVDDRVERGKKPKHEKKSTKKYRDRYEDRDRYDRKPSKKKKKKKKSLADRLEDVLEDVLDL